MNATELQRNMKAAAKLGIAAEQAFDRQIETFKTMGRAMKKINRRIYARYGAWERLGYRKEIVTTSTGETLNVWLPSEGAWAE